MFKRRINLPLPVLGIVAFSVCSINSVANLFLVRAQHPTEALWLAAGLVELTTAWLVYQIVAQARKVTRSRISKQDRRFYGGILVTFVLLAVPSFGLSVVANATEFDNWGLGAIFPLLSVACAVGAALPDTVVRFEIAREKERQEAEARRKERELERKEAEIEQQQAEMAAERERQRQETARKALEMTLATLGSEAETLRQYTGNPAATQAQVAETLGASERTVRNHLNRLESLGLVKRNGQGVEVLVNLSDNGK